MSHRDQILSNMLDAVSGEYDKRPGGFIYDALAPAAEQFERIDHSIEDAKTMMSIDALAGDELAQRVRERSGITRREATHATGSVTLTGTGTIRSGDLFETTSGIQFRAIETKPIASSGNVSVEAVVAGPSGNVAVNTITLFPVTLAGFTGITNSQPTRDGFAAESDADLLQRYYDHIRTPATSGNKSHYLNWAKSVSGVGDAKVIPLWDGDNTVKVVVIDLNRQPASPQLVQAVQNYIDPSPGMGEGAAPVGAYTTVVSAIGSKIDVTVTIRLIAGFTIEDAKNNIIANLSQYLKNIAFKDSVVSFAKAGSAVLISDGVEDYSNLAINGATVNITVGAEEVAILGTVTVNVA